LAYDYLNIGLRLVVYILYFVAMMYTFLMLLTRYGLSTISTLTMHILIITFLICGKILHQIKSDIAKH